MKAIAKLEYYVNALEERLEILKNFPYQDSIELKVEINTLQEVKGNILVIIMQLKNNQE